MITNHKLADPIGPGTAAWNEFDRALAAYARGNRHDFAQHRAKMRWLLRARSPNLVESWTIDLHRRILLEDFE